MYATDYNAIAEVDINPTERRSLQWLDALEGYSPAVGRTSRGRAELIITLPAVDVTQAARTAAAVLTNAAGQLLTLQVMPTDEFDRRSGDVPLPELVGTVEAAAMLGKTRQWLQQLADSGALPSVKIGKSLVFARADVERLTGH